MATSEATSSPLLMLVTGRVRLKPFVVSHVGGSSTNTSLPDLLGFPARDWGYRPSLSIPTAYADGEFREIVKEVQNGQFLAALNL
ncbi:hypothetical protein [Phormidesmis priestleyi]